MKRIIYLFILLTLTTQNAAGFDIDWSSFGDWFSHGTPHGAWSNESTSFTIYYDSYDGQKNKVRLSARVYVPQSVSNIRHIILSCHPTVTENRAAPTGNAPLDGEISRMYFSYGEQTAVVCPDYCGYGVSAHLQHPYLISDVTARNCIDGLLAAIEDMETRGWISYGKWDAALNRDFSDTSIVGYSQGGATALACAKYLESYLCPQWVKDRIKLWQTTCGDGPYSPLATVEQYLKWGMPKGDNKNLEYACVLPLIVAAAKEAYGEGCMRTVKLEDYFSEAFSKAGIIDLIKTKSFDTDVLDKKISEAMDTHKRPVDVFSDKIINPDDGTFNTTTKEYKCLMRALKMADLTVGWTPTHPIQFFHFKSDRTVPYCNFEKIFEEGHIGYNNSKVTKVDIKDAYNALWDQEKKEAEIDKVDLDNCNHGDGGTVFYTTYMFTSKVRKY